MKVKVNVVPFTAGGTTKVTSLSVQQEIILAGPLDVGPEMVMAKGASMLSG
jgi:hypothetical protein